MVDQNKLLLAFHRWYYKLQNLNVPKSPDPIRFGVLGAADFAPIGLYDPAKSHPEVTIVAVAARSLVRAQAHAKTNGIPRAYGSYDELLEQDDIDAVYIPLPVTFHAEWAIKAMRAGKHVLIEKPMCANADEARAIKECAEETGKVAMEAMHWQFHPAVHVVKSLMQSGKYGQLKRCEATLVLPAGMFSENDIRFHYDLGGGSCMDLGYVFSTLQYYVGGDEKGEFEVVSAKSRRNKKDERVDEAMEAEMVWKPKSGGDEVKCRIHCDLAKPKILGIIPSTMGSPVLTLEMERGTITFTNYVCPHYFHDINIEDRNTGLKMTQKHYSFGSIWGPTGDSWWSTYRYQLEAFVDKLKGGIPRHWIDLDESLDGHALIDRVYEKAGMGKRGMRPS